MRQRLSGPHYGEIPEDEFEEIINGNDELAKKYGLPDDVVAILRECIPPEQEKDSRYPNPLTRH